MVGQGSPEPDADELAEAIRADVGVTGSVRVAHLLAIDEAIETIPASARLWELRGDLIQLAEEDDRWSIADAESSYLKAAELEPATSFPRSL